MTPREAGRQAAQNAKPMTDAQVQQVAALLEVGERQRTLQIRREMDEAYEALQKEIA